MLDELNIEHAISLSLIASPIDLLNSHQRQSLMRMLGFEPELLFHADIFTARLAELEKEQQGFILSLLSDPAVDRLPIRAKGTLRTIAKTTLAYLDHLHQKRANTSTNLLTTFSNKRIAPSSASTHFSSENSEAFFLLETPSFHTRSSINLPGPLSKRFGSQSNLQRTARTTLGPYHSMKQLAFDRRDTISSSAVQCSKAHLPNQFLWPQISSLENLMDLNQVQSQPKKRVQVSPESVSLRKLCVCSLKANPFANVLDWASCKRCGEVLHKKCILPSKQAGAKQVLCPFCFMRKSDLNCDPVEMVGGTVFELKSFKEFKIGFSDPQKLKLLESGSFDLDFRFIRIGTTEYHCYDWPRQTTLSCNSLRLSSYKGALVTEPFFIKGTLSKLNLFKQVFKTPFAKSDGLNISLTKSDSSEASGVWAVAVYLVRLLRPQEAYNRAMDTICHQNDDSYYKRIFEHTDIERILIPMCHPSKPFEMIETSVRGVCCEHAQVFDLQLFLDETQKTRLAQCPICRQPCISLVLDRHLMKVMNDVNRTGKSFGKQIAINRSLQIAVIDTQAN